MSEQGWTLVTGASSGIGRQIAIRLSKDRNLIVHGRDLNRLEETLKQCDYKNHVVWAHDLSDISTVRESLQSLCQKLDEPVIEFVHSAGMPIVSAARLMTLPQMQQAMNVNTFSALEICALLLKKNPNKSALQKIVFISSIWSQFGSTGHTIYCATKGALDSAMRAMSVELAPDVRVNSLALGAIDTPMANSSLSDPSIRSHLKDNYPLGIGSPNDAAAACEFLLSDDAAWMTGQTLVLDGGRTAHMSNK